MNYTPQQRRFLRWTEQNKPADFAFIQSLERDGASPFAVKEIQEKFEYFCAGVASVVDSLVDNIRESNRGGNRTPTG
jgi:hypothetical protein